jgi:ribonuclease T2
MLTENTRRGAREGKRHTMISRIAGVAALLALLLPATPAAAQYYGPGYQGDRNSGRNQRAEPGQFDYYVLSLSWSPTFCAEQAGGRNDDQCRPRGGRPYAFVLHGLWPQHERGWPQDCRSEDRGFVPRPVARRMLDIMPSEQLVFHEYRKHGTCSGLGIDGYFDLARKLYEKVKIPPRFVGLTDPRTTVSPTELMQDFMAANPELKPDMIVVQCGGAGNRLKEVRICFDKGGGLRACGRNEEQAKLCSADRMYVPPVRLGGNGATPDRKRPTPGDELLPGPRERRL